MFYHTDAPVLPHWGSQQSGWWLIYHHPINPYAHTYTHIYCLFYRYPTIIHIYIYILFHHTELSICFTAQIAHYHIYIHIYSVSPHRVNICFFPHKWPSFTAQIAHYHIYIHIYIYTYTHTYILRFTTQSRHIFFHTDGLVLPHSGNQQSGWWLIHHHLTHPYVHTHTHKCTVCVTNSPSSYIHICMYISVSPHRVKHLSYHTDSPPSCMYIHIHTYSVSPHRVNICFTTQMAQFYHTRETHNLDGDLSITILYTRICTHIYCLFYR